LDNEVKRQLTITACFFTTNSGVNSFIRDVIKSRPKIFVESSRKAGAIRRLLLLHAPVPRAIVYFSQRARSMKTSQVRNSGYNISIRSSGKPMPYKM
jgi:hypothetical protein